MSAIEYTKSVPPSCKMIQPMIDAEFSLRQSLAELIANSIDKDATQIDIRLSTKQYQEELVVNDNGDGCPNLELMIKMGSHVSTKNGTIGRHGIGFKDAAIWLGNSVLVDSCTRGGKKESLHVDWTQILIDETWPVKFKDDAVRTTHGMTISIKELRKKRITGWKYVPGYIADLFSAAIDAGVIITVDGKIVKSLPMPLLSDSIPFLIKFDGRVAKGICGILVDKTIASGWNVRYNAQTIVSNYTREGFGLYSPHGFWGMLYMIDDEKKWKLSRNKTSSENLTDMLNCQQMQDVVRPIFEKIQQATKEITLHLAHQLAVADLNGMLQKIKVSASEDGQPTTREKKDNEKHIVDRSQESKHREPRQKRRYARDELSKTKKILQLAERVQILPYQGDGKSIGYAELINQATLLRVNLDVSTNIGKNIQGNSALLTHTAIMLMSVFFGTAEDLPYQLSLPMGETPSIRDKIEKICAWLLKHVPFSELKATSVAA